MRTSITLTGVLGTLLLASACGAAASSAASSTTTTGTPAATRVTISYPIAQAVGSADGLLARCPSGATCRVERNSLGPVIKRTRWVLIVDRTLSCGATASGQYADPAAACRALETYARARRRARMLCACPLMSVPQAEAIGEIDGRQDTLTMGVCGACGVARTALLQIGRLTPGALAGSAVRP
jgi:hypothetical protein